MTIAETRESVASGYPAIGDCKGQVLRLLTAIANAEIRYGPASAPNLVWGMVYRMGLVRRSPYPEEDLVITKRGRAFLEAVHGR
jgi:hypothetical protein